MLTVDYIKANGLESLIKDFSFHAKYHPKYPNLVMLKYDQIETKPPFHPIVKECRGLILDMANNWKVVSYPYRRFANYGDVANADVINWNTARIYSKADGSLTTLYYYDGQWQVASSGLPDAGGEVFNCGFTFAQLFWKVWNELGYALPTDTNKCYMFELCTVYNRVVVKHSTSSLVFHGARDLTTLQEVDPLEEAKLHNWECIKIFPAFESIEKCDEFAQTLSPETDEGFVICDMGGGKDFNRVKIKSEAYKKISRMRESFKPLLVLDSIRKNESLESLLDHFPEYTNYCNNVQEKYDSLLYNCCLTYDGIKNIVLQKDFAAEAKKFPFSDAMFKVRKGNPPTFQEYFSTQNIKKVAQLINLKDTANE